MNKEMAENTQDKPGKNVFSRLWRVITVGSLAASTVAGCEVANKKSQTPISENTPPIVETYTPPPTETSTPIPTEAPTETPTPTEVPRFENLIPASIEDVIKYNSIDFSTPEKMKSERAILKAAELKNMPTNPADCSSFEIQPFAMFPGEDVGDYKLIIKNPKVSSVTYVKSGIRSLSTSASTYSQGMARTASP